MIYDMFTPGASRRESVLSHRRALRNYAGMHGLVHKINLEQRVLV